MIINEEITSKTREFIKYSTLFTPKEFEVVKSKIYAETLPQLEQYPKAKQLFMCIVENANKCTGGGTIEA